MRLVGLVLCLINLLFIGSLPRVFFKPGRLNAGWWLTAVPFVLTGLVVLSGTFGLASPAFGADLGIGGGLVLLAVVLCGGSVALIVSAVRTHREPVSLWHQDDDTPARLVTEGPYRWVRHPLYSAFILTLVACFLVFPHAGTGAALLLGAVQLNRTAAREEGRLLASDLGPEYGDYRRRTGRFVPRIR